MIQWPVELHAESPLGGKASGTSWANCVSQDPDFTAYGSTYRPKAGAHYWETKSAKHWQQTRALLAIQTAETAAQYPAVSCVLRLWVRGLDVTTGAFNLQIYRGPPDTWWDGDKVAITDDDDEYVPAWDGGELLGTIASEDMSEGAYVYFDIDLDDLTDDSTDNGGYTFFRLISDGEDDDPAGGATPELDDENQGSYVECDGPQDDHPPALVFTLDLDQEGMQQLAVDIDAESRVTVTVTRRSNTQDSDGNFGTGTATTIAENVVVDIEPIAGIATERRAAPTGYPEEMTHLMTPEMPLPMVEHGDSPGVDLGDDVVRAYDAGGTVSYQIIGINELTAGHQEIHLKEMKARP